MNWNTVAEMDHTVSDPMEAILKDRNITDVEAFLYPKLSDLYAPQYDPFLMKDMDVAVTRIFKALTDDELILVAGDYDADGVTSTSLLVMGLEELDADVDYAIPNRTDGYGLSKEMVQQAFDDGVSLIITCDNGIAAMEAIAHANKLGLDVIVTDHHEPQEQLPNAYAIVNPKRHDCPYPTKQLAGVGVVFKLLQALHSYSTGDMKKVEKYIDIVSIGTVADVMELVGENRILVKYGLQRLAKTKNRGLKALFKRIGLAGKEQLTVKDIGWSIGPVLNAVGRLYYAGDAVEMLVTESRRYAHRMAKRLDEINTERKALTLKWSKKIIDHIEASAHKDDSVMIVPYDEEIPEGLVGLIAGKLKEKYNRPIILMVEDHKTPDNYKGSGRSIAAYNMFDEIIKHKSMLATFGGHGMACGVSLPKKDIDAFRTKLNNTFTLSDEELEPTLDIDYEIDPELLTIEFIEELHLMEPFGNGNPKPLFLLRDVFVQYPKAIGAKSNHLKFVGQSNEESVDMIGWSMYATYEALTSPKTVDVTFHPGINEWNGRRNVQLEIQDIRIAEE